MTTEHLTHTNTVKLKIHKMPCYDKISNFSKHNSNCVWRKCFMPVRTEITYYSPFNILWKLPICISPCSETPLANCDLHSKSLKKCHKSFKNLLKISLKLILILIFLVHVFCMYKGVIQKSFNQPLSKFGVFVQAFGRQLSIFNYLVLVRSI